MTKEERRVIEAAIRNVYSEALDAAFRAEFGVETETVWNIVINKLVTSRIDGRKMNTGQLLFCHGYTAGFDAAESAALAAARRKGKR